MSSALPLSCLVVPLPNYVRSIFNNKPPTRCTFLPQADPEMVAIARRDVLLMGGLFLNPFSPNPMLSLESCARIICESSPREFRQAVSITGCFLYRGEQDTVGPAILTPSPDLLNEATYDHDMKAVAYFSALEDALEGVQCRARPSTGHIGTATSSDAATWGNVVSVWPLGKHFSYVWPKESKLFYPNGPSSRNTVNIHDSYVIDDRLPEALVKGKEILFWASVRTSRIIDSSFLAVPETFSSDLQKLLRERRFGLRHTKLKEANYR